MQPDLTRAHVPVQLDRQRVLCFDHKATFHLMKRYGLRPAAALYERIPLDKDPKKFRLEIRDIEALQYFLWAGLQRDAEDAGETLTLERAAEFITPLTIEPIFTALLPALSRPLERKNGETASAAGATAVESDRPAKKSTTGKRHSASEREGSD